MESKKLIMQTYIKDDIQRNTVNTYKQFPRLERLSKKGFKKYALRHNIDYEFVTSSDVPNRNSAHWLRMEMFNRPEYDEVLYVDCDILINKDRFDDNIFDYPGQGVNKIHFYTYQPYDIINAGVTKWTREECEIMGKHIDKYYHDTHNQNSINQCFMVHIGKFTYLPYKFNVTHKQTDDIVFQHYAGSKKLAHHMKQCPIWKQYKGDL